MPPKTEEDIAREEKRERREKRRKEKEERRKEKEERKKEQEKEEMGKRNLTEKERKQVEKNVKKKLLPEFLSVGRQPFYLVMRLLTLGCVPLRYTNVMKPPSQKRCKIFTDGQHSCTTALFKA